MLPGAGYSVRRRARLVGIVLQDKQRANSVDLKTEVAGMTNESKTPEVAFIEEPSVTRRPRRSVSLVVIGEVVAREGAVLAGRLVEYSHMRLDAVLVNQPTLHVGRAIGTVAHQLGVIEIEAFHRTLDHAPCCEDLGLPHRRGCFDIDDDRILDIDQIIGGVSEEGLSASAPVQRAAGSVGEMKFGLISVATPNAASSSTARYSLAAHPAASGRKPSPPTRCSRRRPP